MFNPSKGDWNLRPGDNPEMGTPVFILVEPDVILDEEEDTPFIRRATLHRYEQYPRILYWKLLDYDENKEEEILQQCFSVIGWRYVSHEAKAQAAQAGGTKETGSQSPV